MGGFLALAGGLADRSGLEIAGAITAGIGVVMIAPGVYLIVSSGSRAEIRTDRGIDELPLRSPPLLGLGGTP